MPRIKWMVLSFAVLLVPICALADTTGETDWLLLPSGGTYSWSGNSSDGLVGNDIGIGSVTGLGTQLNNLGVLGISYGSLDFTSGAYNGNGSNWSWGPGGTLNVTGCIAGVTSATCTGSNNVTLLSDDFTSVSIVPVVQLGQYGFDVVFGDLQGNLNSTVASYFGLSEAFTASSLNLLFTKGTPGHALSGTNIGGIIKANSAVAVTEDASLAGGLALYAIAAAVFALAWRLGVIKPVRS